MEVVLLNPCKIGILKLDFETLFNLSEKNSKAYPHKINIPPVKLMEYLMRTYTKPSANLTN